MTNRVRSNVIKDRFDRSVFFGVVGKNPSMKDLPGSSLRVTVVHKTLKILLHGVNLCGRKLCHFNDRAGECEVVQFTTQFLFWTRPRHSLLE